MAGSAGLDLAAIASGVADAFIEEVRAVHGGSTTPGFHTHLVGRGSPPPLVCTLGGGVHWGLIEVGGQPVAFWIAC